MSPRRIIPKNATFFEKSSFENALFSLYSFTSKVIMHKISLHNSLVKDGILCCVQGAFHGILI